MWHVCHRGCFWFWSRWSHHLPPQSTKEQECKGSGYFFRIKIIVQLIKERVKGSHCFFSFWVHGIWYLFIGDTFLSLVIWVIMLSQAKCFSDWSKWLPEGKCLAMFFLFECLRIRSDLENGCFWIGGEGFYSFGGVMLRQLFFNFREVSSDFIFSDVLTLYG